MMVPRFLLARAISLAEHGRIPDPGLRWGIRRLCDAMLEKSAEPSLVDSFAEDMRRSEVAQMPDLANEQHYEVPAEFFRLVLGPHLKYSCGHWSAGTRDLAEAEAEALEITASRAGVANGQDILELGCGWGSLTLWMAERYPQSRITAVSNSSSQIRFISERARERALPNVRPIRADMNQFDTSDRFDRVVSVEMFEHMRNYETLLERIAGWLRPEGKLFVHIFCHESRPYRYETEGPENWMGRHFFSGGIMPSRDLLGRFDRDLRVAKDWYWDGTHYQRTAEAWLERLDAERDRVLPVLTRDRDQNEAAVWFYRWRLFFLACAELFGYRAGQEWGVAHYLLEPTTVPASVAA